jgi:hypothetical protein
MQNEHSAHTEMSLSDLKPHYFLATKSVSMKKFIALSRFHTKEIRVVEQHEDVINYGHQLGRNTLCMAQICTRNPITKNI